MFAHAEPGTAQPDGDGGGAVDARTTSDTGNVTCCGPAPLASSIRTAAAPLSAWGWCTVVSGGSDAVAVEVSSNPVTERSDGHLQPERPGGLR